MSEISNFISIHKSSCWDSCNQEEKTFKESKNMRKGKGDERNESRIENRV